MHVQLAEARGKVALLHRCERLAGEEQDEPVVERVANLRDVAVAQRRAEVEAFDDGPDGWGEWCGLQRAARQTGRRSSPARWR
jgi:hypothetical protein